MTVAVQIHMQNKTNQKHLRQRKTLQDYDARTKDDVI